MNTPPNTINIMNTPPNAIGYKESAEAVETASSSSRRLASPHATSCGFSYSKLKSKLLDYKWSIHTERSNCHCRFAKYVSDNKLYFMVFTIILLLLWSQWCILNEGCALAHDAMPNLLNYEWKLRGEGRWLNYLLFPFLKSLNHQVIWLLSFGLFSYFSYCIARNLSFSRKSSFLFALTILFIPQVHLLADWPLTVFPMYVIAAAAAYTHKKLPVPLFFVIYGVLFCGSLPNLYFALPLLFIGRDSNTLLRVIVCWILGYIVGFAVSQLMTFLLCGSFIKLAQWRNPNYVTDWQSLLDNICRAYSTFSRNVKEIGWLIIAFVILALPFYVKAMLRNWRHSSLVLLICLAVALSAHVQSIPAGINISVRSLYALYMVTYIIIFAAFHSRPVIYNIALVVVATSAFTVVANNTRQLNWRKETAIKSFAELKASPCEIDYVLMLSSSSDFNKAHARWKRLMGKMLDFGYNRDHWVLEPVANGFKPQQVVVGPMGVDKIMKSRKIDKEKLQFNRKGGYFYTTKNRCLILKLDV